ncbi:hypothetical protein CsatB_022764 [Cannabis sativa]
MKEFTDLECKKKKKGIGKDLKDIAGTFWVAASGLSKKLRVEFGERMIGGLEAEKKELKKSGSEMAEQADVVRNWLRFNDRGELVAAIGREDTIYAMDKGVFCRDGRGELREKKKKKKKKKKKEKRKKKKVKKKI